MSSMTFKDRVTLTLATRGLTMGVGLLSSIVTARWLGPEGRGILVTLSVITGLALQFGNLGLHSGNVYYVSREPQRTAAVLGNSLWLGLLLGVVGGLAAVSIYAVRAEWFAGLPFVLVLVTAAALPFQFLIFFFQNTLLGMQEVRAFNLFEAGVKVLSVAVLAAYLIPFGGGPGGAVVLLTLVVVLGGITSVAYCAHRAPFRPTFDAALFSRMIRYGVRAYLACLFSFLVIRSDMLLVNYYLGTGAAGIYSIAVQIGDMLLLIPVTVGLMLMPRIAAEVPESQASITARVSRHAALMMSLLCGAAFVAVGPVVEILYGEAFVEAIPATRWLLAGIWALGMNGILMNHFAGQGLPWLAVGTPLCGLVVNVALNLILIPSIGLVGAAAASTVAYVVMFSMALGFFVRPGRAGVREALVLSPRELVGLLGLRP